jgi:CMP-N-acetylneuraminic acid synthetase
MAVKVFLPCRKGSERVHRKNIRPFGGNEYGLIEIKLRQLIQAEKVSAIYLSTNDSEILDYADSLNESKLHIHQRKDSLATSQTSTDALIGHAVELIEEGDILWTHVTSPFMTAQHYNHTIEKYYEALELGFDSLMTTNIIHGFIWDKDGPVNYNKDLEKWPRTQTIKPLYEVNSAAFLANADIYRDLDDRIGRHPYLYPLGKIQGLDIDWEDDFKVAEAIFSYSKDYI